jgi:hypothetical protein
LPLRRISLNTLFNSERILVSGWEKFK